VNIPFGDLASYPERKWRRVPRLYLGRQRGDGRAPIGMNRESDNRFELRWSRFALVACREQDCAASRNEKSYSDGRPGDGRQEGARKCLRVKTGKFHDVHKAGDGPVIKMGGASEDTVCLAACFAMCASARFGMPLL
jgi:hypothetical protein